MRNIETRFTLTKELRDLFSSHDSACVTNNRIVFKARFMSKSETTYPIKNTKVFMTDYNGTIRQLINAGAIKTNDEIVLYVRDNGNDTLKEADFIQHQICLTVWRGRKIILNDVILYSNALPSSHSIKPYELS